MTQKENVINGNDRNNQTFTKWYYKWQIVFPNKQLSPTLYGKEEIKQYISKNNLGCKYSMLLKHKHNKGYQLIHIK